MVRIVPAVHALLSLVVTNSLCYVKFSGMSPLAHAARNGELDTVKYLVTDVKADVNFRNGEKQLTALMYAAAAIADSVVVDLIKLNADTDLADASGNTALHYACVGGSLGSVLPILMDRQSAGGGQVSSRPNSSTTYRASIAKMANRAGQTALHTCCTHGHIGIVSVLLKAGADVNAPDAKGLTPLVI
jgi:ankyrin repeat protein